jgi:hypothetical protein
MVDLAHRIVNILLELNVLNVEQIERQLKNLAARSLHPAVKNWLMTVARNHIINLEGADAEKEYQQYSTRPTIRGRHRETPTPDQLPTWAQSALSSKKPVHHFDYVQPRRRDLWQSLETIVDWFNTWPKDKPELKEAGRLSRISFDDALKQAQAWKSQIDKSPWMHIREQAPVVKAYENGFKWVRLLTGMHLKREDTLMNHCVGGANYIQQAKSGSMVFYSLRDPRNKPHITVAASKGANGGLKTDQVKANSNKKPAAVYQPYLADFLKSQKITVSGDAHNVDANAGPIPTQAVTLPDEQEPSKRGGDNMF